MVRVKSPSSCGATERTFARAVTSAAALTMLLVSAGLATAAGEGDGAYSSGLEGTLLVRAAAPAIEPAPALPHGMLQFAFAAPQLSALVSDDGLADPFAGGPLGTPLPERKPDDLAGAKAIDGEAEMETALAPATLPGPAASKNSAASRTPLLGSTGDAVAMTPVTKRWSRVAGEGARTGEALETCVADASRCASEDISDWARVVREGLSLRKGHRIAHVNRAINRMIAYREDIRVWKRNEFWATPEEALSKRAGDCEDFAILKYWSLRLLGFDDADMRIVVLRDTAKRAYHAVLAVAFDGDWLILDNRFSKVQLQRNLPNYQPLYSLNTSGQWAHGPKKGQPVRLASRLKELGLQ